MSKRFAVTFLYVILTALATGVATRVATSGVAGDRGVAFKGDGPVIATRCQDGIFSAIVTAAGRENKTTNTGDLPAV